METALSSSITLTPTIVLEKTTNSGTFSSNDLPAVDFLKLSDFNKRVITLISMVILLTTVLDDTFCQIDDAIDQFKSSELTSVCYEEIKNIQNDVDLYFVQHEKPEVSITSF